MDGIKEELSWSKDEIAKIIREHAEKVESEE